MQKGFGWVQSGLAKKSASVVNGKGRSQRSPFLCLPVLHAVIDAGLLGIGSFNGATLRSPCLPRSGHQLLGVMVSVKEPAGCSPCLFAVKSMAVDA